MRAAKIGREMACLRAVACHPQSAAVGLREIMLRAEKYTISETLSKNRLFQRGTSALFWQAQRFFAPLPAQEQNYAAYF
jgi:hypothetical protein